MLISEVENAEKTLATIRQASIDAPGAMQSHSDTTKFQMGGLADELATSILGRRRAVEALEKLLRGGMMENPSVVLGGTIVEVEDVVGVKAFYFVLPEAGGIEVDRDGQTIMVVTYYAPLAAAFLGKAAGTVVDFPSPGNPRNVRKFRIVSIE
jgi:hypothetical protein